MSGSALAAARPPRATIIDPVTLEQAAQQNPTAISSTNGAFFAVAVRRDLLLAPRSEHWAIIAQARRFTTMGEVGVYCRQVPHRDRTPAANRHPQTQNNTNRTEVGVSLPTFPQKYYSLRYEAAVVGAAVGASGR